MPEQRPPFPPFTRETAITEVRQAEDGWNTRAPGRLALACTPDSRWRNRAEFITGRDEIVNFLTRKWNRELDYRLIKELWAFQGNRIAVRFAYECHDDSGQGYRSYGNENWEFDDNGLMRVRHASINDLPIAAADRKYLAARPPPRRPPGSLRPRAVGRPARPSRWAVQRRRQPTRGPIAGIAAPARSRPTSRTPPPRPPARSAPPECWIGTLSAGATPTRWSTTLRMTSGCPQARSRTSVTYSRPERAYDPSPPHQRR
jgi:nuclear transport factor 2 (NTF2) superfamily protein